MDEKQFREALKELTDLAFEQGMCISHEQIAQKFPELVQNEEQKQLLLSYLKSKRISVGDKADLDEFLSMEERNYMDEYVASLGKQEEIAEEEFREILLSASAGDSDAQQIVVRSFLPKAVELAGMYAGQGILIEDLIGEGNLALFEAVSQLGCLDDTEDIMQEAEGFLGKAMMDAMERLINGEADEQDMDERVLSRVNRVAEIAAELAQELRRKVSPEEVASESELSLDEVLEAVRISANKIEDIELSATEESF